jgi:DNA-binding Lrp family transcriptional regulator
MEERSLTEEFVDALDRKILDSLYADSSRSQKRLSATLGISEPSLTKRKSQLEGKEIIKSYSINIGYDKIGYDTNAVTLVRLKAQKVETLEQIVAQLMEINDAIEVYTLFGEWDIFVRWLSTSPAQVQASVQLVSENENVAHAQTFQLTTEHKRERGPQLISKPK